MKRGDENGSQNCSRELDTMICFTGSAGVDYKDLFRLWLFMIFSCTYLVLFLLPFCGSVCFS